LETNRRDNHYRYTKIFGSVVFVRKYLLPWCRVPFPNLLRLVEEKDEIMKSIEDGFAPTGIHEYW
jgi:hypothetical protein